VQFSRQKLISSEVVSECFPITSGFKIKEGENFNHPAYIQRDRHPYIEYFEDLSASGGLKFEPVEAKRRSRSAGTQILDKRGRFEIGSSELHEKSSTESIDSLS